MLLKKRGAHRWLVGGLANEPGDDAATVRCRQRLEAGSDLCNGLLPGGIAVAVGEGFERSIGLVVQTRMLDARATEGLWQLDRRAADAVDRLGWLGIPPGTSLGEAIHGHGDLRQWVALLSGLLLLKQMTQSLKGAIELCS